MPTSRDTDSGQAEIPDHRERKPLISASGNPTMPLPKAAKKADAAIDYGVLPELIGYQLRLAQVRVFRDFMQTIGNHEISPGLLGVLMLIEANPGLKQSEMAAAVHLDRSTMVGVIDRLERRGWVVRKAAATDRRAYQLMLTETGATLMLEFRRLVMEHEKRILAGLSQAQIDALRELLPKICPT